MFNDNYIFVSEPHLIRGVCICVFLARQVCEFGCRSFALLFDDIEPEMCAADKEAFSSFAHAQVSITNEVYQHLQKPQSFLFCPTGNTDVSYRESLQSFHHVTTTISIALYYWR